MDVQIKYQCFDLISIFSPHDARP